MSKAEKKFEQAQSRFCPEKDIIYNGLTIRVKPLRWGQVPVAEALLNAIMASLKEGDIGSVFREYFGPFNTILSEAVSFPGEKDFRIEDVPFDAMPDVLQCFAEQNFSNPKWQALAQGIATRLGVDTNKLLSQSVI